MHRRRRRRAVLLVVAIVLAPILYSYLSALRGPGTDSVSARSVEWMREHHLGGIVNSAERNWYNHHQAKVGGTPDVATATPQLASPDRRGTDRQRECLGRTDQPVAAFGHERLTGRAGASPRALPPPPALTSPAPIPVPGEGRWTAIDHASTGQPGAYATVIRPDAVHTSVLDAVVWLDPHLVRLRQYPGTRIPGAPWDRPDHIPTADQRSLIAAFNGGFRLADSHGGLILGHSQIAPMRDGAATLMIDPNGMPSIGPWGRDIKAGQPMDSARQNLDLIVDAVLRPQPAQRPEPPLGVHRTGQQERRVALRCGHHRQRGVRLVGGPGLTVETLATTLVKAGAVRGMQMDINNDWVQFNTYTMGSDGQASGTKMLPGMRHTRNRWLTEDSRDFIAVFARAT